MIHEMNRWDVKILERIRNHPHLRGMGLADQAFTREQLVEVAREIPREWILESSAIGSARQCAGRLCEYLDAGADAILLHGSAPTQMEAMVDELKLALDKRIHRRH